MEEVSRGRRGVDGVLGMVPGVMEEEEYRQGEQHREQDEGRYQSVAPALREWCPVQELG